MASPSYTVENTTLHDLEEIFGLFELSIAYQEKRGVPVWRNYDKSAIVKDIENKSQYKITIGPVMAIVFSVAYTDKVIWRHRDQGDSLYLHRIVVNPAQKGQRLFAKIMAWCTAHGKQKGLQNIRMDTWADNPGIQAYYQSFGFSVIENYTTPDTEELPVHNRNLALTLLEFKIT